MKRSEKLSFLLLPILIMAVLSLTSCSGGDVQGNDNSSDKALEQGKNDARDQKRQDREGEQSRQPTGVPVRTEAVSKGKISTGILATAVVEAEQTVDIYSRVTGTVTKLAAEEGDTVGKNDLLCQLEDEELRLAESKAKSVLEKAKRDLERIKLQVEKKVLAENDLIVSERLVRLGQKVDPSVKLFTLFDPKSLVVKIHVPEGDYFGTVVDKGKSTRAEITSESLPGLEFPGQIKRIAPIVDPQTNTIKITIKYEDPKRVLRPGMYVRVKLVTDTHREALLIPKSAILYDENRMYVFVIRDGKAKRITLEPGFSDNEYVESLSGIEEGDKLVVVGQTGLKDGAKVRIVDEEPPQTDENGVSE